MVLLNAYYPTTQKVKIDFSIFFFFYLGFQSQSFTMHRTARERGRYSFNRESLVSERKSLNPKLRTLKKLKNGKATEKAEKKQYINRQCRFFKLGVCTCYNLQLVANEAVNRLCIAMVLFVIS